MIRKFKIENFGDKGQGLVSNEFISKGSLVLRFGGILTPTTKLPENAEKYLQIDKDLYLSESNDYDDYVNHSCRPNCILKIFGREAVLICVKDINKNDEVTFDYSTSCTEPDWYMPCHCGESNCRKIITCFGKLPEAIKSKYCKGGAVPKFVF